MSSVDLSNIKEKTKQVHAKHKDRRKEKRKKRAEKKTVQTKEFKKKRRQNIVRIIKINWLSLAALPALILATVAKMMAAALRQFIYLLVVTGVILAFALAFRIQQNPQEYIEGAASVIASIALGGIFSLIVLKLIQKFAKRLKKVAAWMQKRLDSMFDYFYHLYLNLIQHARKEIEKRIRPENIIIDRLQIVLFVFVRWINQGIAAFVTNAFYVFTGLLLIQLFLSGVRMSIRIQSVFGISLQAYLGLFPVYELVYAGVLFLIKKAGIFLLLVFMGKEWKKWGEELKDAGKDDRKENEDAIIGGKVAALEGIMIGSASDEDTDKANEAQDLLKKHLEDFEDFKKKVVQTVHKSNNYMLRKNYTEYVAVLKEVTEKLSSFDIEIPIEEYVAANDKVKKLDSLKKDILSLLDLTHAVNQPLKKTVHIEKQAAAQQEQSPGFFHGCDTEEKLDKRFQGLLQIFDADSEAADETTLAYINQQYKKKKKKFQQAQ